MEQTGLELAPIHEADSIGIGLACYAKAPAPYGTILKQILYD